MNIREQKKRTLQILFSVRRIMVLSVAGSIVVCIGAGMVMPLWAAKVTVILIVAWLLHVLRHDLPKVQNEINELRNDLAEDEP